MNRVQQKIISITNAGYTEAFIVKALADLGVHITQPTINRIKSGKHKRTTYETGEAISILHQQLCATEDTGAA